VASAAEDRPLSPDLVVIGELGLSGEVRRVGAVNRRLAEAGRLGFTRAVVPPGCGPFPPGMQILEAGDLREALRALPGRA
jgi:DNA repair protein RadA/Sms